jgi:hypothetical protein
VKNKTHFLVFAALLVISEFASAGDDESVRAPYVEPGECWSYRTDNFNSHHGPIDEYELCVTLVDKSKDRIFATATVKADGREIDAIYSSEWAGFVDVNGDITPKGSRYLRFPLSIADVYSVEWEYNSPRRASSSGEIKFDMTVVGWEDITVPAGTFRVLRIEGRGSVYLYTYQVSAPQWITFWYSPKVNRHVKMKLSNRWRSYGEEMTGYHLNQ